MKFAIHAVSKLEISFFAKDSIKIEAYTIATYCQQVSNKINTKTSSRYFQDMTLLLFIICTRSV